MAEKTYIVRSVDDQGRRLTQRFGYVKNRKQVDEGAMEGRDVRPISEYVEQGQEVKLDPSDDHTKRALEAGVIEEPGASQKREAEQLQARLDQLKAEQDALAEQQKSLRASKSGG